MLNTDTKYTFDADTFSDLFKDVFGVRPRNHRFYEVYLTDPDEAQKIWDWLLKESEYEALRLEKVHAEKVHQYEAWIDHLQEIGAPNREAAIRWIIGSYSTDSGTDYICWDLGLNIELKSEMDIVYKKMQEEGDFNIEF